jgi:hypothetical protein
MSRSGLPEEETDAQIGAGSAASRDGGLGAVSQTAPFPASTLRGANTLLATLAVFVRGSMR